jgi:hypothetical protein
VKCENLTADEETIEWRRTWDVYGDVEGSSMDIDGEFVLVVTEVDLPKRSKRQRPLNKEQECDFGGVFRMGASGSSRSYRLAVVF